MVLYKGQLFIKQHMESKPVKWEGKLFLYRESDIAYNMVLFQNYFELNPKNIKNFSSGGSVV